MRASSASSHSRGGQREAAHVHQRVADPHDGQQGDGRRRLGHHADERDRGAPQRDAERRTRRRAGRARTSRKAASEPGHRPGADRRVEHADARLARAEHLDGEHHAEHAQAAAREGLRGDEAGEQEQRAVAGDGRGSPRRRRAPRGPWRRPASAAGPRSGASATAPRPTARGRRTTAKTAAGPLACSSTAARAGPASVASGVEQAAHDVRAGQLRGLGPATGSRAECAGRYSVWAIVAATRRA